MEWFAQTKGSKLGYVSKILQISDFLENLKNNLYFFLSNLVALIIFYHSSFKKSMDMP